LVIVVGAAVFVIVVGAGQVEEAVDLVEVLEAVVVVVERVVDVVEAVVDVVDVVVTITGAPQFSKLMALSINVMAAPAKRRPFTLAPAVRLIDTSAKMFPENSLAAPSVPEVPRSQNTLHAEPPLIITMVEAAAVVMVVPIWKTQIALASPAASSVRVPVSPTLEE